MRRELPFLLAALAAALPLGCGSGQDVVTRAEAPGGADHFASLPPGWSSLPPPPLARSESVSVWTGGELILWGGNTSSDANHHADGAAFDPVLGEWEMLPPSPLAGRSAPGGVWTGRELVVWGGYREGAAVGDGAAYDPVDESWRVLEASPLSPRVPVATVWTGSEVLVWGDAGRSATAVDGAAYDPVEDSWRSLPPAPLALNLATAVWSGKEMIVVGAWLDGNNHAKTRHAQGVAYDPEANEWRLLPAHALSPQASTAVWIGDKLVVWDYELRSAVYDPLADRWSALPDLPLRFSECYPQGAQADEDLVFAWHCGIAALFHVRTREWQALPGPFREIHAQPLSAGGVVLFAGAIHEEGVNALWAYKPGEAVAFVPREARDEARAALPVTFPDGTSAVLTYPEELGLAAMGVQPDAWFLYRVDPSARFPLAYYRGPVPTAALGGGEPIERLVTRAGDRAELWEAPELARSEDVDAWLPRYRLVFRFGSWSVVAYVRDRREAGVVAQSLDGRETADGFVALAAFAPIALSDESGEGKGVRLTIGDAEPDPLRYGVDEPFRLVEIWVEPCSAADDYSAENDHSSGPHALRCLEGELTAQISGDRAFVKAAFDGLRARDVRLGDAAP